MSLSMEEAIKRIEAVNRVTWDIGWVGQRSKQLRLWNWPNVVYRYSYSEDDTAAMNAAVRWVENTEIRDNMQTTEINAK